MKNKKTLMFIYFIVAIGAYIIAALSFIGGHNTSLGVTLLCLGSAMLCFGSIQLNKMNNKDEEKDK